MGYLALLRLPFLARLLAGSLVGRLPGGMAILMIPLALRRSGLDYGFVGLASGALAVSAAVGGPVLGRLVDRVGQVKVLVPAAVGSGLGFAVLALAPGDRVAVLVGVVLAGAAAPPLEPCIRILWPSLVSADKLASAYALDSAAQELIFVSGPLVVAGCVAWASPVAALWLGAVLGVVGVLVVVTARPVREWRPESRETHWLGPLRSPGLVVLLASLIGLGVAIGTLNVFLVDYAEHHRFPGGAGTLMAINAFGSLLGALAYGARTWRGSPPSQLLWLRVGLGVSYALLLFVPAPPLMVVAMVLSGVCFAPSLTVLFMLTGELAPAGTATEAFAWLITLFSVGAATGSAITGFVVDHASLGAAAVTAVAGVGSAVLIQLAGQRFLTQSEPAAQGTRHGTPELTM
ncbi:MFS transporter [Catenulispora yoronensis]|uniref:MFS transporter n=1 Tax=Catenulispora yoronensis TaxID=450799 RepID=A0ABN2U1C7_9ACTN